MSPERLAEIRARCEAATGAAWFIDPFFRDSGEKLIPISGPQKSYPGKPFIWIAYDDVDGEEMLANARFIAAARQDVPDLLAEVEALRAVFITSKCPACGIAWSADECEDMRGAGVASCLCGYRAALSGKEKP